jgi:hypothetical protein
MKHFESERTSAKSQNWRSSGREPYVFSVDRPQDLFGVHAHLIEAALRRNEGIRYLIYAPIWQGREAPFGIHASPASHGVAVTEDRFLISEDHHIREIAPTILSIPFDQVLCVEVGSALILGWLVIRFLENDKLSCTSLLYSATTGGDHFNSAIREYRRIIRPTYKLPSRRGLQWHEVYQHTPLVQGDRLRSLTVKGEYPVHMVRSSEFWGSKKRWWKTVPVSLAANATLISTNVGLTFAVEESAIRPNAFSFGVNISCISFNAVKSAHLFEEKKDQEHLRFLRLGVGRNSVSVNFDIPFDEESYKATNNLVRYLMEEISSRGKECIS